MVKLRVWWIPQVPMKTFYVEVANLVEAKLMLDALAHYDIFQFENNVKGDYCNAGGLQQFDEEEQDWLDWYNEDDDRDIDDFTLEELRQLQPA